MGFFSKLSNNNAPVSKSHQKKKSRSDSVVDSDVREGLAGREMMSRADRELYQFEAPAQELGLSDLISRHKSGERFQFLALTGGESETYEARMRRMVTFRPRTNKEMIPLNDLPHIKLIQDTVTMNLSDILPKKSNSEYVRIASLMGYFSPLVSVMSKFSKAKLAIMDSRFDPPAEIQSVTLNTNIDAKIELSMDYCIPLSAAGKIRLMVSREQATMVHGEQWGALQAQVQVEMTSFPYMSDMKRVVGILGPTASALEDHQVNPNTLDITMTESNRRDIRELYQQGDIVDEGEPITIKKKAIKYAKSSIRELPKGELTESSGLEREGWGQMTNLRKPAIPAEQVSNDSFDEDDEAFDEDHAAKMRLKSLKAWESEQDRMRNAARSILSDTTEEIPRTNPPVLKPSIKPPVRSSSISSDDSPPVPSNRRVKSGVQFSLNNV